MAAKFLQRWRTLTVTVWMHIRTKTAKPAPKQAVDPANRPPDRRIFKVYRFAGIIASQKPKVQSFEFDVTKIGGMVLDALIKIKEIDPTVTFRRSCREGICGSCGINLQGANCLACITEIPKDKVITILPLPHMYVQKDLVVDMSHFFQQYNSVRPYLVRPDPLPMGVTQYAQSIKDNSKLVGMYECILCACCSTSCPSYWWNGRRFMGPAALLHTYRWVIDSRDSDTDRRLWDVRDDFKVFRCHTIMVCMLVCPKGLHPGIQISSLKRLISKVEKKPEPELDPLLFANEGLKTAVGGGGRGPSAGGSGCICK
ncbi:succinate dehydrogenase iron-sulfur subunit-like [Leguminivora glycinivorella]|uniref:succinate dehydrogenase iron-sulfur subunit-like n=1 Tax=Leguminivora glycinivorella TaxID=1035111 RepID=UPI00200F363B|nr:succinate dehydrogenase iron-sulfur subunit-like [Leguminivora glycinivorella]